MSSLVRVLSMIVVCSLVLAVVGCAEDNEAFVKKQAEANAGKDKTAEGNGHMHGLLESNSCPALPPTRRRADTVLDCQRVAHQQRLQRVAV